MICLFKTEVNANIYESSQGVRSFYHFCARFCSVIKYKYIFPQNFWIPITKCQFSTLHNLLKLGFLQAIYIVGYDLVSPFLSHSNEMRGKILAEIV